MKKLEPITVKPDQEAMQRVKDALGVKSYRTLELALCLPECTSKHKHIPPLLGDCTCGAADRNRLVLAARKWAAQVSFHRAAEGGVWEQEAGARAEAERQLKAATDELESRFGYVEWAQDADYLL